MTELVVEDYLGSIEKSILKLYDSYQDVLQKNSLLVRKNREMEYGLRVAQKSLNVALTMEKEDE